MSYRGVRGSVTDRWYKSVRNADGTTSDVPAKMHGCKSRYAARYVDQESREHQKVFVLKREAEQWLRAQLATVDAGTHVNPRAGHVTVDAFYIAHVRDARGHLSDESRKRYACVYGKHVLPRWGKTPIGKVTPAGLSRWVTELRDAELSVSMIYTAFFIVSSIMEAAVSERIVKENPCRAVELPKHTRRRRGYLTHAQVLQLAERAAADWRDVDGLIIRFLSYTGLRIGEMASLCVGDVNLTTRRVMVWETKNDDPRSVPFPASLVPELTALCTGRAVTAPLFPARRGAKHIHTNAWREHVFNPAAAALSAADKSFPKVTPHDLRHTSASLAVAAGASVLAVQRMLGHGQPSLTLNTYADLFDSDLDTMATALDTAVVAAESLRKAAPPESPTAA